MLHDKQKNGAKFSAAMISNRGFTGRQKRGGYWKIRCLRPDGSVRWTDEIKNLVVDAGVNYSLDASLSGGTPITSWFIMLTDATPTIAAGDTMASHVGWVEDQNYDEATREAFVDGGVSAKSLDNVASVASFAMNATTTIGGAALTSVNTKGGTTGTLYAAGAFTGGNKAVDSGDTLQVTATFTGDDDGV